MTGVITIPISDIKERLKKLDLLITECNRRKWVRRSDSATMEYLVLKDLLKNTATKRRVLRKQDNRGCFWQPLILKIYKHGNNYQHSNGGMGGNA